MITPEALAIDNYGANNPQHKKLYPGVKVSAVIITYNEEENVRRTLSQLYWCDEIVIVDSFSTDKTAGICKAMGARVFTRVFDGYGTQKRYAVSQALNDWVLCIDADEVLTDKLIEEICKNLNGTAEYSGFSIRMNMVFLDSEFVFGKESGRAFLRLFNKQHGGFTEDKVHESIQVNGPVKKLQHTIRHYSYTSLNQCLEKCNRYSTYSAEMAFKKGKNKSVFAVVFGIPFNFFKYYILERNFMNGLHGFYWSVFSTYYHFAKYVKLIELHKNHKKQPASTGLNAV
jgi:glycosyltransferase involved in cell wall biosynthesis